MRNTTGLFLSLLLAACGTSTSRNNRDGFVGGGDQGIPNTDGGGNGSCDDQHPCPTGQRCLAGACIPDNGTCTDDNDCQNDTWCDCTAGGGDDMGACMGGVCVPYGDPPRGLFDPQCQGQAFSATDFKPPVLKCSWMGQSGSNYVTMTPLVVDLDGDGKPEIVFGPMGDTYSQRLVAIRSTDCSVMFDKAANLQGYSQYAAADLDGDKVPEIVGVGNDKLVRVFDNMGNLLATSPTAYSFSSGGSFDCSGPAIANVDGTGGPEIVVAGQVLRYTKGSSTLQVLWTKPVTAAYWGTLDNVADLDGDGKDEVVVGNQVFDALTGADKTPSALAGLANGAPGAYPAIADFNGDKKPDIVIVQSAPGQQKVAVVDVANNKVIFGPYTVSGGGWGGPPTVADFDGDKVPDFGLAGSDHYYVYSLKCAQSPKPADCTGADPGTLWEKATHDTSSGGTGSSVFDFNGDGKAEVVYRDECWLRVYNGPDGKTVFAANVTSGTALELPVIADIDNDGHADIVTSSDNIQESFGNCPTSPEAETGTAWSGYTTGVYVYRDPMNRWMPSRGIWNEHAYHITNVNDDTTIPTSETPNWTTWNDYRQNVQGIVPGMPMPEADFTGGQPGGIDNTPSDCVTTWNLRANLCNRGTATVAPGVPGTFYSGDPRSGGSAICSTMTTMTLKPGDCETVSCIWANPPQTPVDLWFRADDDGKTPPQTECKSMNDLLHEPNAVCSKIG